jgi:hypothetical protein
MDERERRVGENEVLFRRVNEQMRALDQKLGAVSGEPHAFICECGDLECGERIFLRVEEYEQIHADGARFVIVPGHEQPDVEDVLEDRGAYFVIRKHEDGPAQLAREQR